MKFSDRLIVAPGQKVRLADCDPDETLGFKNDSKSQASLQKAESRLVDLQYLLAAENRRSLLIVLQALDTGGKDGTIRHVMSGLNPQFCKVTAFKVPSQEEASHDFLWRVHKAVPAFGQIGIFNRSHYEDVLIARVHELVAKSVWAERYQQINDFEQLLVDNNVKIVKFFLHISRGEQKRRLEQRLSDPQRNWKLTPQDLKERSFWPHYVKAYEAVLRKCSTKIAPWFIVPANHKWFRNLAVSHILMETLEEMNPHYPRPAFDLSKVRLK